MDLHSHINLSFLHMNSSSYGAPLFVDFKFFLSYSLASFFFFFFFVFLLGYIWHDIYEIIWLNDKK